MHQIHFSHVHVEQVKTCLFQDLNYPNTITSQTKSFSFVFMCISEIVYVKISPSYIY